MKIILLLFCSMLFSAQSKFRVKDVSGDVLVRFPGSVNWEKAEMDSHVPYASLIEIGQNGKIILKLETENGTENEISLKSPMVVRLDDNILRKVESESIYIPAIYANNKNSKQKTTAMFNQISDAWQGFSAIMEKKNIPMVSSVFKSIRNATQVVSQTKVIKLYIPQEQTTIKANGLPLDLKVQWQKVSEEEVVYEIKMWTKKDTTPIPVGRTKDNFYTLHLPIETEYLMQVSTTDGKWKSSVRKVYLTHPIAKMGKDRNIASSGLLAQIPLVLPKRGFVLQTGKVKQRLYFQWEVGPKPAHGRIYSLNILNEKSEVVQTIKSENLLVQLSVKDAGKYFWYVESTAEGLRSETREFTIEKQSELAFENLFSKRLGQVIYLDK